MGPILGVVAILLVAMGVLIRSALKGRRERKAGVPEEHLPFDTTDLSAQERGIFPRKEGPGGPR